MVSSPVKLDTSNRLDRKHFFSTSEYRRSCGPCAIVYFPSKMVQHPDVRSGLALLTGTLCVMFNQVFNIDCLLNKMVSKRFVFKYSSIKYNAPYS